jgi:hypothetical protein
MARAKTIRKKVVKRRESFSFDDLCETIKVLIDNRIYFTLANPTIGQMTLHIATNDVKRTSELLPDLLPDTSDSQYGKTIYFSIDRRQ